MGRQEIVGTAVETELAADITPASVAFTVVDASGWPTGGGGNPFVVTIGKDSVAEEKILCASRTGTTISVTTRGYDGTTAADHVTGVSVIHSISAALLDEMNAHVNDDTRDDHSQYLPSASSVAGDGLSVVSRVLSVNTDGVGVETNADAIRLKDNGTTNAKLADMATARIKGRTTSGTGDPEDLTIAQVLAMLSLDSTDLSDFNEAVADVLGAFSGFGGSGLTFTYDDAGNTLTLNVNVDGVTLEISSDAVRIKDGAVTQAKIATGFRVISVGTAHPASPATGDVSIRTDLGNKLYIYDGAAWALGLNPGAWDTFTPILGQGTALTKTVNYAKFFAAGRLRVFEAKLTATATGTASAVIEVTLPEAAAFAGDMVVGAFNVIQAPNNNIGVAVLHDTTTLRGICHASTNYVGASPSLQVVSGTVVSILAVYETAA